MHNTVYFVQCKAHTDNSSMAFKMNDILYILR